MSTEYGFITSGPDLPISIRIPDYVSEDVFHVHCVTRRLLRVQQWNARARQLPLAQVQVIAEELEELLTRNFIFAPERMIDAVFRHNRKLARKASMQPGSSIAAIRKESHIKRTRMSKRYNFDNISTDRFVT